MARDVEVPVALLEGFSDWCSTEDAVYDGCPNCGGSPCVCILAKCCGMPVHPDEGGSCSWCGKEEE